MHILHATRLTFVDGNSAKEYRIQIEQQDDAYLLRGYNGPIGRNLTQQDKGAYADLPSAEHAFAKLLNEKTRKGYRPDNANEPSTINGVKERAHVNLPVQLLTPIDSNETNGLLEDNAWCAQEKFDGERLLAHVTKDDVVFGNRRSLATSAPSAVTDALRLLPPGTILDGELVGNVYHVFDLLTDTGAPYERRLADLSQTLQIIPTDHVRLVETANGTSAKAALLQALRAANAEGIVFKHLAATHEAGRSSGARKFKFYATATCRVRESANGGPRSIALELLDANNVWAACGRVTVPSNLPMPAAGAFVEVRYLYAMPQTNALYQPVLLGERHDSAPDDCTLAQLKYQSGGTS